VTDALRPRQGITLRLRAHRGVARLTALLLVLTAAGAGLTAGATLAAAAITTPFAQVYSINTPGDIQIRGNTLMTCQTAVANCSASRDMAGGGTASNGLLNDNNYWMVDVDVDSDASTFNSSSSTVDLPAGASVLYAGLVWGGRPGVGATIGGVAGVAAPTPADTNKVKLKAPGQSSYSDLTASSTATNSGNYQSFVDVTSIVQAGGNGSYSVANVQSGQGGDSYAGWGLAIAYSDASAPPRNLTIFRGYGSVGSGESFDIPVSGFTTPPSGAVRTTLGAVSYEGDLGSTGDQLLLGKDTSSLTQVHDVLHAPTNVFNSTISDKGADSSTRSPKYKNQLGFDAATFNADGFLPNSATTADIRVTSSSETYYPGLITFATDLYAPELTATKTEAVVAKAAGNTQSGVLEPGDTIEYTIDAKNIGLDAAKGTVLTDAVPAGTTYVPGSLSAGGVSLTDPTGDDIGSFSSATKKVTVDLGTGATSSAGGKVVIGASTSTVKFRVTASASIANNQSIDNVAAFSYASDLAGTVLTGVSNAVTIPAVRHHSQLSIAKSADVTGVQKGAGTTVTYTLTATNAGPYDDPGVTVSDTLPSGATYGTVVPSSGTCSAPAGQTVSCNLGAVANGGTATVTVHAVLDAATDPAVDSATVSGTNVDSDSSDNTATRSTFVNRAPVAVADSATTAGGGIATINVRANDSDADGNPLTVSAPGGTAPTRGTVVVTGNNVIYTATAGEAGTDTFSYVVDDGRGGTATALVTVTIPNQGPDAIDDASSTTPGSPVTVPVLSNDIDPNIPTVPGQHLAVTAVAQPTGSVGTVTSTGTDVTFAPAAGFTHGSTTFTYSISDAAGGTDTATVTITIANVSPVAAADAAPITCGTTADIDVLANDSDPNGDTLTVTAVNGASHGTATLTATGQVHYAPNAAWSGADVLHYTLSDGTTSVTGQLTVTTGSCSPTASGFSATLPGGTDSNIDVLAHVTDPDTSAANLTVSGTGSPAHGHVTVNTNNHVIYTPDAGYAGADSFTYTARDADGNASTATVTLAVLNQAPTAGDDTALVPINGSVDIPVLGNDTDPNGDTLTVSVLAGPSHGTARMQADGTVRYVADHNFFGDDSFTYSISDGNGGTASATVTASVANLAPTAIADFADFTGTAGVPITIDVLTNDSDANGDPLTIDGVSRAAHGTVSIVAGKVVYSPVANFTGDDTFTYLISDGRGGQSSGIVTVTIHNRAPHAIADEATTSGGSVTLDVRTNDSDADGDPLTVTAPGATTPSRGSVSVNTDGTLTYTATTGQVGTDAFSYVVDDGRGGTDTAVVTLTIPNAAPHATADSATTTLGNAVTVPVLVNDTDANSGQPLAVSAVTQPGVGKGSVSTNGTTITFTPSVGFTRGTASFTYTVSDGDSGFDTADVTISMANVDPVANSDTATTTCVTAIDIDVVSNDTDANSDPLTLTGVTAGHGTATIVGTGSNARVHYRPDVAWSGADVLDYTLSDGTTTAPGQLTITTRSCGPIANPFSVTVPGGTATIVDVLAHVTDPDNVGTVTAVGTGRATHGTVGLTSSGQVSYTPDADYAGLDSFDYTVTDVNGNHANATVALTIANQAPAANSDAVDTLVNDPVDIDVLANDTDANGDALTVTTVSAPSHGTAVIHGGRITYQPVFFYGGADSFTYAISDGHGGTSIATVTVTLGNAAPVANGDIVTAAASGPSTFDVVGKDTDANGDALTLTAVNIPVHGSAVLFGNKVVYTPSTGFAGSDSFSYTINDGRGGTSSATVTVTVPNQPPDAVNDPSATTPGNSVTILVLNNDTDPNILGAVSNQHLVVSSVTQPTGGVVTIASDARTVMFAPSTSFTQGTTTFTYTIDDGAGGSDTATVTITMTNVNPVAVADAASTICGADVDVDVLANDSDANGDTLSITAVSATHGVATITGAGINARIHYVPDHNWTGVDLLHYTLDDGTSHVTGQLTITTGNCDPTAGSFAKAVNGATTTSIDVLAHSSDPDNAVPLTVGTGQPAHGTATLGPAGTILYTPAAGYAGPDGFTYTVTDEDGNHVTATVTLTVGNVAPHAVDDVATTAPGKAVVVSVLDNDSDPNTPFLGQGLHITGVAVTSGRATASVTSDGQLRVVPTGKYTGVIVVTYTIADATGATATATVSVNVTAKSPASQALGQSITLVPDQKSAAIDPATAVTGHGSLTLSTVQHPGHGVTVSVKGAKLFVHRTADQTGTVAFAYVVVGSDGVRVTVTETVHVLGMTAHNPVGPQASVLPHTGADVVPAGLLGIALTVTGALACLFASRRKEEG
jgi:large repetitive protein